MIFGLFLVLLYIFLKQTAPDLETQNFLFIILIVVLIVLSYSVLLQRMRVQ